MGIFLAKLDNTGNSVLARGVRYQVFSELTAYHLVRSHIMKFYILEEPESFWGDYSDILTHGMAAHSEGVFEGPLLLSRTGPYIPPISFPGVGNVVVTDEFKKKIEDSGLRGFSFMPVIKKHIVRLDWQEWDKTTDDPPEFPESGEPEDYILERAHSSALAEELGPLWEIVIEESATVKKIKSDESLTGVVVYLVPESWNGNDFFRAHDVRYVYLTEKARDLLKENCPKHVSFKEAKLSK